MQKFLTKRIPISSLAIASIIAIFMGVLYAFFIRDIENHWKDFTQKEAVRGADTVHRLDFALDHVYRYLKTMSQIPSVKELSYLNSKLSPDAVSSFQSIYNSVYETLNVSEIYIVPEKFNPQATGVSKAPIFTFDQYITGVGQAESEGKAGSPHANEAVIPEIEEYEYQVMYDQLRYLRGSEYAKLLEDKSLPMLSGKEVITCDNSFYKLDEQNDQDRKGLVLSVPYYNSRNEIGGLISVVVLTRVLKSFTDAGRFSLKIESSGLKIDSDKWLSASSEEDIYVDHPVSIPDPQGRWIVSQQIPYQDFLSSKDYDDLLFRYYFLFLAVAAIGAALIMWLRIQFKMKELVIQQNENLKLIVEKKMKELEESNLKLMHSSKLSLIGEMAAGVAHEIKNPLAVIDLRKDMLLREILKLNLESQIQKKLQDSIEKISSMVLRMNKIINSLRKFSRKEDNDPFESVNLKGVIESAIEITETKIKNDFVSLSVDPIPDIYIECRAMQLEQVFVNLIINSADAIGHLEEKWINIKFQTQDGQLKIFFRDSGSGLTEEEQKKILSPFFTTKEIGKGTGLGLTISRTIMTEHHGSLDYNSKSPNTEFIVTIPLKQLQVA